MDGRALRGAGGDRRAAAGRPMDLRLPATEAPALPPLTEPERLGDAYAVVGLDARRQVVALFRAALDRLGAVTERVARRAAAGPGPDRRAGGDPPAPDDGARARSSWRSRTRPGWSTSRSGRTPGQRLRSVVRRHALLLVDGDLQREGEVVNVVAREVRAAGGGARGAGGPDRRRASASWARPGCGGWATAGPGMR